jgi:hypothetical protein
MSLLNALRGIGGEFELGRLLLASSGIAAITTPIGFELADLWHNGWHFDVTAWCVAYPGGLGALAGIGVFAIGNKDRNVSIARQTAAQPPLDDKGTQP